MSRSFRNAAPRAAWARWQLACLLAAIFVSSATAAAAARHFAFVAEAAAPGATLVGPNDHFSADTGYGFDLGTAPGSTGGPFFFSIAVPEGNHRVTITFGDPNEPSDNTVRAETRQLMLEQVLTRPGELVTHSFIVNVRNPRLPPPEKNAPGGTTVVLGERERGLLRWDEKLTLEFNGRAPRVRAVSIEPVDCPTIFLLGDSTVTDQPDEPNASWGQMLPRFLKPEIAVANHAQSGETLKSTLTSLRFAKVLSQLRPGDWVFLQFGHNDQKQQWPQTYVEARTTYRAYLRTYIAEIRLRGATPVLVTSMQRRTFDAHGRIRNTHGEYPQVVRELAAEEKLTLVDLDRMSVAFYEALGPEEAPLAFADDGRDPTHHNNYGAYELAKCVVQALRDAGSPLTAYIREDVPGFDPARPDPPGQLALPPSQAVPARTEPAI